MKIIYKYSNAPPQTRGMPVVDCHSAGGIPIDIGKKSAIFETDINSFLNAYDKCRDGMIECHAGYSFAMGKPAVSAIVPVKSLLFRLTGRDGPPGSQMITGAPAWLARGTPVCINARDGTYKTDNPEGFSAGEKYIRLNLKNITVKPLSVSVFSVVYKNILHDRKDWITQIIIITGTVLQCAGY